MLSFYGLKNKLKIKRFLNIILAMCYTANNSPLTIYGVV